MTAPLGADVVKKRPSSADIRFLILSSYIGKGEAGLKATVIQNKGLE
jgi:hypothetical protein